MISALRKTLCLSAQRVFVLKRCWRLRLLRGGARIYGHSRRTNNKAPRPRIDELKSVASVGVPVKPQREWRKESTGQRPTRRLALARGNLAARTITQEYLLNAKNYGDKEKLPLKQCNPCKSAAEQSLKSNADLRDKMFALRQRTIFLALANNKSGSIGNRAAMRCYGAL